MQLNPRQVKSPQTYVWNMVDLREPSRPPRRTRKGRPQFTHGAATAEVTRPLSPDSQQRVFGAKPCGHPGCLGAAVPAEPNISSGVVAVAGFVIRQAHQAATVARARYDGTDLRVCDPDSAEARRVQYKKTINDRRT